MEGLDRKMDKRLVMSDKNKNKCRKLECKENVYPGYGFLSTTCNSVAFGSICK